MIRRRTLTLTAFAVALVATALTLASGASSALASGGVQARVVSFDWSPTSGTRTSGQSAFINVHFNQPVVVTGDPVIFLGVGSNNFADLSHYESGSGTNTLTFRWTPKPNLQGAVSIRGIIDGLWDGNATLKDTEGNNAEMHLVSDGNVYTPTGLLVDTTAPTVLSVDGPAAGTYKAGDTLTFTAHFDRPMTVLGFAALQIELGNCQFCTVWAEDTDVHTYQPEVRFTYTVPNGVSDSDGIRIVGPLSGWAQDENGHHGIEFELHDVGSTSSVLVDAVAPTVTSIEVPAAGFYGVGDQLDLVMHFDEDLVINLGGSIPVIFINVGGQPQEASYVSGHGSELTFRYTVQAGDISDDGLRITGWLMRGAYFFDAAGNEIDGTLHNVGDGSHVFVGIDAPTTPTPAPAPAPAPEAKDTTPPTKPATATAKVKGGQVQVSFGGSTDNIKVVGYRLYRDATAIATVEGTDFKLPVTLNAPGKLVLQLRALDSAGNLSEPVVLTLTRKAHPKAPKVKPAWAWKLARWQDTPASKRGARPHTPSTLPTWHAKWNAWHKAPVKVTVG